MALWWEPKGLVIIQDPPRPRVNPADEALSGGGVECTAAQGLGRETAIGSITIGAYHFAIGARAESPPGLKADRVLDEFHRAVSETNVDAAGVVAGRRYGTVCSTEINPRQTASP